IVQSGCKASQNILREFIPFVDPGAVPRMLKPHNALSGCLQHLFIFLRQYSWRVQVMPAQEEPDGDLQLRVVPSQINAIKLRVHLVEGIYKPSKIIYLVHQAILRGAYITEGIVSRIVYPVIARHFSAEIIKEDSGFQ